MVEVIACFLGVLPVLTTVGPSVTSHRIYLSDLRPVGAQQGYGELQVDKGLQGTPLKVAGRTFAHGLGTHAPSEVVFDLQKGYDRLVAWVGVDGEVAKYKNTPEWKGGKHPSVDFKVFGDGKLLFESGLMQV